jgi:hypothetical protein
MTLRHSRFLAVFVPLGLAFAAPAFGADVFAQPPLTAGAYSWTGFYAGANLGGSVGQGGGTMPYSGIPGLGSGVFLFNAQPAGVLGGGQAGYNYQFGNVVLGLETDIQGSGADDKTACFLSCLPGSIATLDHKLAWFGRTFIASVRSMKTNKKLDIRRGCGDGDWERLRVILSDDHGSSRASLVSRFDARHVTIFF